MPAHSISVANKEVCVELNAKKIKYVRKSRQNI